MYSCNVKDSHKHLFHNRLILGSENIGEAGVKLVESRGRPLRQPRREFKRESLSFNKLSTASFLSPKSSTISSFAKPLHRYELRYFSRWNSVLQEC